MKFYTTLKLLSVPVKQLLTREHISPYLCVAMKSILADVTWEPYVPYFLICFLSTGWNITIFSCQYKAYRSFPGFFIATV